MTIWKHVQSVWQKLSFSDSSADDALNAFENNDNHASSNNSHPNLDKSLSKTQSDLGRLLSEKKLSCQSREVLAEDYRQLHRIIDKLEKQQFHIAVFGRVSVGKSSLLNALLGQQYFSTSVLHGETKATADIAWQSYQDRALHFVDTPGIDEFDGEVRADIAKQAIKSVDMVLFVVDGDLTQIEFDALASIKSQVKSLIVIVNKADRLTPNEITEIKTSIGEKLAQLSKQASIPLVFVAADPRPKTIIQIAADGQETQTTLIPENHVDALKTVIWQQLSATGHQLQALSAAMFATQINDKIGREIVTVRADVATDIIRKYCIGKALAVGLNPIPLLDISVVVGDVAMIKHLGEVYGFDINKREATALMTSIMTELGLVLGTSFGIQALSSVLKGISAGLSTLLTASAQGVAAYYGTYLVGKACEEYFKKGASWGEDGPEKVLDTMLENIDKETILAEAKADIQRVLRVKS